MISQHLSYESVTSLGSHPPSESMMMANDIATADELIRLAREHVLYIQAAWAVEGLNDEELAARPLAIFPDHLIEGIENAALWHRAMGDLLGRASSRLIDAKARALAQGTFSHNPERS
jgi:hypothetical protein